MRRGPLSLLMLTGAMASLASGISRLDYEPKPVPRGGEPPPFLRRSLSGHPYSLTAPGRALTKAERQAQAQAGEKRRSLKERKARRAKRKQRGAR